MLRDLWFYLLWVCSYIVLDWKMYYRWSRFYRRLVEENYRTAPIPEFQSESHVESVGKSITWTADRWWMLWDVISFPAYTYWTKKDDCDGISLLMAYGYKQVATKRFELTGKYELYGFEVRNIRLMSVPYLKKDGSPGGHNVLVFDYLLGKQWAKAWASNWFGCKPVNLTEGKVLWSYADIASEVCKNASNAKNVRYAVVSLDLKTVYETGTVA